MTGFVEKPRSADIVYQDVSRELYIWIWCDHSTENYTIHKCIDPIMNLDKYCVVSRQEMREELLSIEEEINTRVMKPQWHRIKGENVVLNVMKLYKDDDELIYAE